MDSAAFFSTPSVACNAALSVFVPLLRLFFLFYFSQTTETVSSIVFYFLVMMPVVEPLPAERLIGLAAPVSVEVCSAGSPVRSMSAEQRVCSFLRGHEVSSFFFVNSFYVTGSFP